ncbi:metal ABC transporter ATP-binding protein [Edaphobacillus lindanitolerans]|uniref:Zinc transport system ATP-binding protein n=1 Tax=Edaphobacillus lindanitolerans TaxID=550447 RepID=A0A1U7PJM5_9BACI|nr:metal ABC transporter ATP-binding protein [Edaphobacillus lindanitolerans]SIT82162.1 zinc transport system ATP-binding protein [Edaphobacillus lindanitolerans]
MPDVLIELEDVSYRYGDETALEHVSLQVRKGEFWAVIGPNGSGKSTLIKLILGLIAPQTGQVQLFGKPVGTFRNKERIGYVSQKSNAFNSAFPATVSEVVKSGLVKKTGMFRRYPEDADEKVMRALDAVGMAEYAGRSIGRLSGGQQQRVFIARALISGPELLILDEPTVGIDREHMESFYDMLGRLNREKSIAILLVTHDVDTVSELVTHVACVNRSIHFHGPQEEYNRREERIRNDWYGHPVRRIRHPKGEGEK